MAEDLAGSQALDACRAGFEQSARHAAPEGLQLEVAGVPVSLRLSPALARLYRPAFAATTVRDRPRTETTIDGTASLLVWDSASTGVPAPPSPWSQSDYLPRDGIRGSGGAGLDYAYVVEWRNLSVWDRRDASGVFWAADAGRLPYWDSTAPLRYLVNWALADRGVVLAHAAAVGTSDGGVLLTGRGGSGKSTSALACLAAGWSYVSDDYCALPTTGDRAAHAVYSVGKLDEASCRLLPSLAAHAEPGPEGSVKHLLRPDRIAPKQTVDRLALRAVVVPARCRVDRSARADPRCGRGSVARRQHDLPDGRHPSRSARSHREGGGRAPGIQPRRRARRHARPRDPGPAPGPLGPDEMTAVSRATMSVVIPALDAADTLPAALASVLSLEHLDEVVVVDDGSCDGTAELVKTAGRSAPVRLVPGTGSGPAAARNAGAAATGSPVLMFLDADDWRHAGGPDPRWAALDSGADIAVGAVQCHDARGAEIEEPFPAFLNGSYFMTRAAFEGIGGYGDMPVGEEVELLTRARDAGLRFEWLGEVVLHYRLRPGSISARRAQRSRGLVAGLHATIERRRSS